MERNWHWIAIGAAFLFVASALFLSPARSETVAQISICPNTYQHCERRYETSFYTIPVETRISGGCFMAAMQEMAKMALLDPNRDILLVVCIEK